MTTDPACLTVVNHLVKYQLATVKTERILTMTKILTMENWPSLKLADCEIQVMGSWLLYIPAGLIQVHPHIKYQLATISRT